MLSVDALTLAADPNAALSCNITETISCAKVGVTWQANLLGFPNAFIGLIFEPTVVYSVGRAFAYWLFFQACFVIGAMCPRCLLITATTTPVFASLRRVNLSDDTFGLAPWLHAKVTYLLRIGVDIWATVLVLVVPAALVISRYL